MDRRIRKGASPLLGSSGCPLEVEDLSKGRLYGQRCSRDRKILSLTPEGDSPGLGESCVLGPVCRWKLGVRVGFSHRRTERPVAGPVGSWKVMGSQGEQGRAGRTDGKKGKYSARTGRAQWGPWVGAPGASRWAFQGTLGVQLLGLAWELSRMVGACVCAHVYALVHVSLRACHCTHACLPVGWLPPEGPSSVLSW